MKIKTLPLEFKDARVILQQIEAAGFEAYFVGGSVRDTLLGLPIHDVDIASNAYPEEIKRIFKTTIDTGIEHGTVTVRYDQKNFEVTTFRVESGYADFRRPDHVSFVRNLKDDLKRRDFTINALAMKENGEVIDLFNGLDDLNNHLIRAVGNPSERFHEDALRMMRAVRFSSQLNFVIEPETERAISKNAQLLKKIAIERTRVEFIKMMLGKSPNQGLAMMMKTGLMNYVPGLSNKETNLQGIIGIDLHDHLQNESSVWAFLGICCGMERKTLQQTLKQWKCSNWVISAALAIKTGSQKIIKHELTDEDIFRLGFENLKNAVRVANVFGDYGEIGSYARRYGALPIKKNSELAVNGQDLINWGISRGPRIGQLLQQLTTQVIFKKLQNNKSALKKAVLSEESKEE